MDSSQLSRRRFLYGSALVAGTAALSACSSGGETPGTEPTANGGGTDAVGSATEPLPPPDSYQQSPTLEGGDLPPVEERLPEVPYVVPHNWIEPGNYGGKLRANYFSSSGTAKTNAIRNLSYGLSPLRYLNDGLDIGPGLVESWESNDDATEWTFNFRKGLKWSDGEPWTTESIMWWWQEFVLEQKMAVTPPDEARSGAGTLAEFIPVDDTTLTLKFDAPAPLTADRMAMWVNGNIGKNGPIWMMPAHYLKQFHPKTGKDVPDDWDTVGGLMETKADWMRNPDCPTMTGWQCKSFDNTKGLVLERNPYYWCVMPNGDQLPYVDEVEVTVNSDAEAGKLQVQQGAIDWCHGNQNRITLNDVQGFRDSAERAGTEVFFWDSGSGTGSIFFFNYDYPDEEIRTLIREPKFRQAISHAFNREAVRSAVYFNTGELTTGTLSPKAIEYSINDTGKQAYAEWRDSYAEYNPDKAKQILDELGVKDTNGDGVRELPSGKKLTLRLDYQADEGQDHRAKDNQLVADLKEVGLNMAQNPVAPQTYEDVWKTGKLMSHSNWEVGDGPNHLVYPQWLVPLEGTRWAPLQGQWYELRGTQSEGTEQDVDPWERTPPRMEPEAGGPIEKLWDMYDQSKVEPDEMKRHQLVWDMIKVHVTDGPFFMGCVANFPQVFVKKKDMRNIPTRENLAQGGMINPWIHPTPAVYDPETFYWENPEEHA